ncbi:PRA1 family protein-domain-containing protein [Gilbertella persicaria]|uniref:PRA1 family protein-domain-containing protein n=1 Tax=Gilbertella persicaria TaxID=101096 RepID=UPI00221EF37A|nr:PRA1 family protein-domain-containing protein [Gilbertella persicaria]KAI8070594.1 PRA1 family protein-domain-containing protein [Gilbertella persicaria]
MSTPLLSSNTAEALGNAASSMANDAGRSFIQRFREQRLANLRPLSDFFDKNRISFTTNFSTITKRWNYNLQYFSANYLLIVLALSIYAIITSWWLVFTIAFVFGGFYFISRLNGPLEIAGNSIPTSTLYASYGIGSIVLLLFSGATGVIFWIIGAAAMIILGHAAVLEEGLEGDFGADEQV